MTSFIKHSCNDKIIEMEKDGLSLETGREEGAMTIKE
jgi:hypothetical protein